MVRLSKQYGQYGYRNVTALLHIEGWRVNHKKIDWLSGEEGFQLPQPHKKKHRLYHEDISVIRMWPTHANHIWAIDCVHDKLSNGRSYKVLTVLNEYTSEALCVAVRSKMAANDFLDALHPLLMKYGKPEFIRSNNWPESIAAHLQDRLKRASIQPLQIYPGSPWENGYNERFNWTLRREVLNAEWLHSIKQAQVAINAWLWQYNRIRPHHTLGMRPPAPETLLEKAKISANEKKGLGKETPITLQFWLVSS